MTAPDWTPADARLAKVRERLERERAAGMPERPPPPERAPPAARRVPTPDEQLDRERRQELWDYLLANHPDWAQSLRELRKVFGNYKIDAVKIEGRPTISYGKLKPFNAIRIEAALPSAADLKSSNIKR